MKLIKVYYHFPFSSQLGKSWGTSFEEGQAVQVFGNAWKLQLSKQQFSPKLWSFQHPWQTYFQLHMIRGRFENCKSFHHKGLMQTTSNSNYGTVWCRWGWLLTIEWCSARFLQQSWTQFFLEWSYLQQDFSGWWALDPTFQPSQYPLGICFWILQTFLFFQDI